MFMRYIVVVLGILTLGGQTTARADPHDQCALVDAELARRTATLLPERAEVLRYCQPCGDKIAGAWELITEVAIVSSGANGRRIQINKKYVDLAYTYYRSKDGSARNVALQVGCPATGVSQVLALEPATPPPTPTPRPSAPESDEQGAPALFTVQFDGAVVGLTKADGSTWDGSAFTSVSEEDRKRFQGALLKAAAKGAVANPVAAAAGVLTAIGLSAISHKAKPDALGTVELRVDGQTLGGERGKIALPRIWDTYTPSWSLGPWTHIRIDSNHDVRLRLRLEEWDPKELGGNDQIGTVEIPKEDLLRAARLGKVISVYVGDQGSQNQLVFVNISVTLERAASR